MGFARSHRRHQPPGRSRIDSNLCRNHLPVLVLAGELRLNPARRVLARRPYRQSRSGSMATDFSAMIPLAARANHLRVRRSRCATQSRTIDRAILWRRDRKRVEIERCNLVRRKPVATPDG